MKDELIPGILEKGWAAIEQKLQLLRPFAPTVHIDLLDGKFVNNTTFLDPAPFKKYSEHFYFELHMMVDNPIQYLQNWSEAGFKRFIGHVEKMPDISAFVAQAELFGEVGLAIDAKTSIDTLTVDLTDLDCLLIMTVQAGYSGQAFDDILLKKVQAIRRKSDILPIAVDGGVNEGTILLAKTAGANRFVVTSSLFTAKDTKAQFELLQKKLL